VEDGTIGWCEIWECDEIEEIEETTTLFEKKTISQSKTYFWELNSCSPQDTIDTSLEPKCSSM